MAAKNIIKTKNKSRSKSTRKFQLGFKNKSVKGLLALIIVFLAILLVIEAVQIQSFLQFKSSVKEIINNLDSSNNLVVQRPVYIVDSQPIDINAYLREYFATKIPKETRHVTVTAYSSTSRETDDTPFLTAVGTPVRDGIVAANFLPIGTVVRFPDKFGDKLFVVEDRMDERFGLQVDIWMFNQKEAKEFGIQYLKMETF